MFKAFFRDSAVYAVPSFVSRGLSLILVPLYTRVLDPSDYGALDLLFVFANLVHLTVALEIAQGVARFYSAEPSEDRKVAYASSSLWFTVCCYTVFLAIALTFTRQLMPVVMGRHDLIVPFRLGVLYIWFNGVFRLLQNQFRWQLRSRDFATVSLVVAVLTAGLGAALAYGLRMGLTGLLWGHVVATAGGTVLAAWRLRATYAVRIDRSALGEMLRFSAPLVPSALTVFIASYVDRLMIRFFLSTTDVGIYGIGFRLSSVVLLMMAGFQGALTPLVYRHYRDASTPAELARIFRVFAAIALCTLVCIIVFARDVLELVTTPAYYPGATVVVFLAPALIFAQMYIFAPGIGIAKKTSYFVWINLCGATINTVLNAVLIPRHGITGAAVATLIGNLCVFTAYMVVSQRLYIVPHRWLRLIAPALLAAAGLAVLSRLQTEIGGSVVFQLGGVAFVGLLVIGFGLITPGEILRAVDVVKRRITAGR